MTNLQKTPNYKGSIDKNRGEIEKIESLMVNWGLNCINLKPRTILQKACKYGAEVEVPQGPNCIKSKVYGQLEVQLKSIES